MRAVTQYVAREGTAAVRRPHRETIVIDGEEHELVLGIWVANQKQRRDKLTEAQREALRELGVDWACRCPRRIVEQSGQRNAQRGPRPTAWGPGPRAVGRAWGRPRWPATPAAWSAQRAVGTP
ncbi:helicase associated domain-containing protein [Streptomyces sp. NPDC056437]|uniref:helicase associated domain-containing protein n=1 Tax=Streptomyces sp. NPDC056437 TaxID=3345816 RepID=UPI00369D946B